MKRRPWLDLSILSIITLAIFYPLFYTHYFYTDEIIQLTHFRPGANFHMFAVQGRIITDRIFQGLFSSIDTISQITRLRLFSLGGWLVCLPVWYTVLVRVTRQEGLTHLLPFFTVLYLICSPAFCVYVSWASCLELFLANTSGLLAGYTLYAYIKYRPVPNSPLTRMELPPAGVAWCLLLGIISLFTYQNGFGCFLLPFLLHFVAKKEWSRTLTAGIVFYFFTYLLYYAMFRWQIGFLHFTPNDRTGLSPDPLNKIAFFVARPLGAAFRFTWIVSEKSKAGEALYVFFLVGWILLSFFIGRSRSLSFRLRHMVGLFCFLGLIYLPSLLVKENYASNRTLLALDLAVFLLVFQTLLQTLRSDKHRWLLSASLGLFFVANAWYNFRYEFLSPVKKEYDGVRNYIDTHYRPGMTHVTFIRPPVDLFRRKFGVRSSWDEFGMPSTSFEWVPDPFVRQVVFEKTGSRAASDSLVIANRPSNSPPTPVPSPLIIDVENIMQ